MSWTEDKTLSIADETSTLSALLEHEGLFKDHALRWLKHDHIRKFLEAIDAEEAIKLCRFASTWNYSKDRNTSGFPLLDWLWVVGPSSNWEREYLRPSGRAGEGRRLVVRLAELEPLWVGRWWKWCSGGGFDSDDDALSRIIILALSWDDVQSHLPALDDEVIAYIIKRRADLLEVLPAARWSTIIRPVQLKLANSSPAHA